MKIDRKEPHNTGDPWLHLEVERSEVRISRSINAETNNVTVMSSEGETDELQTWYRDGVRSSASPTCALTSKVQGQGYNVTSSVWRIFAHNSTKKRRRSTKFSKNIVRATGDITHQLQGQNVQRSRSSGRSGLLSKSPLARGGAWCGGRTTGRISCFLLEITIFLLFHIKVHINIYYEYLAAVLFLLQNRFFWSLYCQIYTDLDKIWHSPIVRNTLVGRLRSRSARGWLQAKPERLRSFL